MKDNLETFFKHTLENFNDAPTDNVWEELEQRLEPPHTRTFNNKLLLPLLMASLIIVSTFSVIGNISLRQKTEKLTAQIQEKQNEMIDLQKDIFVVSQKYLSVEDYVVANCNPTNLSQFSQDLPFRDEDIIPTREL